MIGTWVEETNRSILEEVALSNLLKRYWIVVLRQRQERNLYNSPSSESSQVHLNCRVARENRKFSVENIKFTMKSLILAQDER